MISRLRCLLQAHHQLDDQQVEILAAGTKPVSTSRHVDHQLDGEGVEILLASTGPAVHDTSCEPSIAWN